MKAIYFILFYYLFIVAVEAQELTGTLYGKIFDHSTNQPIPFASVTLLGTGKGTESDISGNFRILNLPPQAYQLKVSAIGYAPEIKTDIIINTAKPTGIDFALKESVLELEGVTVTSDYFLKNPFETNSVTSFSYEEIRRSPGGFEDVVRALSVLPGVAQADAGRNDLIVRGGAPSENLYLLDGIPIPNINHFGTQGATGGPLSFINLDFVKETTFSTGGFPVLYGDKLSSVLQINLREGRKDKLGGKATISASQFGVNLEGPLSSNSSFLFSARRSYLDFIFKAAGFGFVPEYYDVLSKYDLDIDPKSSLSFLFISAFDNVKYFNDTQDKRYENSTVLGSDQIQYATAIQYKRLFNDGFFTLSFSRNFVDYNTSQKDSLLTPIFLNTSREAENVLKLDLIYKTSKLTELNIGAEAKLIKFNANIFFPPFLTTFGETLPINSVDVAKYYYKYGAYLNYNVIFFQRFTANAGVRLDYFDAINTKYYSSPRLSLSYMLSPITNINFSTGMYHQFPSYIWLSGDPVNKNLKAIQVNQFVLGFDHRIKDDLLFKNEFYYKDYSNYPTSSVRPYLTLANTGTGFAGSEDNFSAFGLEPLVSAGKGFSRGIEVSIQKKSSDSPHYGILSITYNESKFIALDGVKRYGSFDQRWIFNLSGGFIFSNSLESSFKFRYASGKPSTPFNADGTQSVANYNSSRLDPLHSLDLRVDKRWFFERYTLITYLDLQNIYNNKNGGYPRWDQREKKVVKNQSIGILPTIGISLEF
ncbi:MAG: TonB-dependent receptor [Ignavibacteriaceae bacterium]|jgi:hypothetical protein